MRCEALFSLMLGMVGARKLRCVVVSLLLVAGFVAQASDGVHIAWLEDYGQALKMARQESKPMMIDFYTSWCVYCKQLDKESFGDPRVVEAAKGFVCAKLDADIAKAAAMRYPAEGYPTVVFTTPSGEEILRFSGYRTAEQVLTVVRTVRESAPQLARLEARIKQDKKDHAALEALGALYLRLENPERAVVYLRRALKALPVAERTGKNPEEAQARVLLLLGQAQTRNESYKKACKALEKLVSCYKDSPRIREYYGELATLYEAWGKDAKAAAARARAEH